MWQDTTPVGQSSKENKSTHDLTALLAPQAYTEVQQLLPSKIGNGWALLDDQLCGKIQHQWVHFHSKCARRQVFAIRVHCHCLNFPI